MFLSLTPSWLAVQTQFQDPHFTPVQMTATRSPRTHAVHAFLLLSSLAGTTLLPSVAHAEAVTTFTTSAETLMHDAYALGRKLSQSEEEGRDRRDRRDRLEPARPERRERDEVLEDAFASRQRKLRRCSKGCGRNGRCKWRGKRYNCSRNRSARSFAGGLLSTNLQGIGLSFFETLFVSRSASVLVFSTIVCVAMSKDSSLALQHEL